MAIAYRGGYNDAGAANPTSGTWSLSGTYAVAGDFAICVWYSRASTKTITPTGPTLITNNDANNATYGHIWVGYKVIDSTDITNGYVGTWTASSVTNGTTGCSVAVFSGVDTSAAITHYASATTVASGNPKPPACSTTSGNCLVTVFGEMDQNDGVYAPTNFTLCTDAGWSTTSGTDASSNIAYDLNGGTGSSVDPAVFTTTTDAASYTTTIEFFPGFSPAVSLGTPNDDATDVSVTPDLKFTGTDLNSDLVDYQVQVDTVNTFDSVTVGFDLKYVDAWLVKSGTPTDNLTIEIRSTIGGAALGTSNTVAASSVVNTLGSYIRFTFATPVALSASTKYYLVLKRSGARDTSNFIMWTVSTASKYSGGGSYINNSGTWSSESSTEDFSFIVYDTNTVAVVANDNTSAVLYQLWGTGSMQELGQSFTASITSPLLDVNSIDNIGFSGTGDPHPWPSGNEITYTPADSATDTGYFDGSDAAATDPNAYWTTEENIFDSDATPSTYAQQGSSMTGSTATGFALAEGTSFSSLTYSTISSVQVRMYAGGGAGPTTSGITCNAVVYTNGLTDNLGTITATIGLVGVYQWSQYTTLSAPPGGWDLTKLQALEVKVYAATGAMQSVSVYKVEISIQTSQPHALPAGTKYYWRVRAIDPSGTNTWGEWSPGAHTGYSEFTTQTNDSSSESPSLSPSSSVSPSNSPSESPSLSPSSSISPSLSPSSSISPSLSPSSSVSPSNSPSRSPSLSPSNSVSPSRSPSQSPSNSPSESPSTSTSPGSSSVSPSPSPGYQEYTRGSYASLPTSDADLSVSYDTQGRNDVSSKNGVRVGQSGMTLAYLLHEFKDYVPGTSCNLECLMQSDLAPSLSTVYLQIYNRNNTTWDTKDFDDTSSASTDFTLSATISDLTNYIDGNNVISCRVYQLAI